MAVLYKLLNGKSLEVNDHMLVVHGSKRIEGLTNIAPKVKKVVKKVKKKG